MNKSVNKKPYFHRPVVCLSAVAAGTGLAWTSPVLPQIEIKNVTAAEAIKNVTETIVNVAATSEIVNSTVEDIGAKIANITKDQGMLPERSLLCKNLKSRPM